MEAAERAGVVIYEAMADTVKSFAGRIYFDEGLMRVTKPFVLDGQTVPRGAVIFSVIAYPWHFAPKMTPEVEQAFELANSAASFAKARDLPFRPNIGKLASALWRKGPAALMIDDSKGFTKDNIMLVESYIVVLAEFFASDTAAMEFVKARKLLADVTAPPNRFSCA